MFEVKRFVQNKMAENSYLLSARNGDTLIIDPGANSKAERDSIENYIKENSLNPLAIVLTHGHFDHIGGVKAVFEKTGAKVLISKEDEPMLSSSKLSLAAFCGGVQNNTAAYGNVADGDVITLGESKIKVIATPGHTKGGVCYVCDNNVFTGDTMFFCSCGRTDFPGGSS